MIWFPKKVNVWLILAYKSYIYANMWHIGTFVLFLILIIAKISNDWY
jgi:uncharacterized membrane protein